MQLGSIQRSLTKKKKSADRYHPEIIDEAKVVYVHERPINAHKFSGSGYNIIEPESGAGGYKISSVIIVR